MKYHHTHTHIHTWVTRDDKLFSLIVVNFHIVSLIYTNIKYTL